MSTTSIGGTHFDLMSHVSILSSPLPHPRSPKATPRPIHDTLFICVPSCRIQMLSLITGFSGTAHRCPAAFAVATPQCRIATEMVGGGFVTQHYSSQLVQRCECDRVDMSEKRLFADPTVPRTHVIQVKICGADGGMPLSLVAACWWFAKHPQHLPVSLLLTANSLRSLTAVRDLDFADRVHVLYIGEPSVVAAPDFLAPLSAFSNVRKVCEYSQCADMQWMLSCPHLASIDVMGYNRPVEWNAGDVFPILPALRELILYEGGPSCLGWLPRCTNLTSLEMDGCPWLESCDVFSTLTELIFLKVSFGNPKDVSGLARCPKLASLDIGGSKELTDGSTIGSLHHLKQLNISHTGIEDIGWIEGCTALEELSLFNVEFQRGFNSLGKLTSLRYVSLTYVGMFSFDWVSASNKLEEVSVESFDDRTVVAVESLRHARMLRKLRLPLETKNNLEWIVNCVMLEELTLSCGANATRTVQEVFSLPRLRELTLSLRGEADERANARAAALLPAPGGNALSPVEKLHIAAYDMSDAQIEAFCFPGHIRLCTKLKTLTLKGVPLRGGDGAWLEALGSLQTLTIIDCEGSSMLDAVGSLTELRELSLSGVSHWTGFAGAWRCHRLQTLSVQSCSDGTALEALRNGVHMHALQSVHLGHLRLRSLSFLEKATATQELTLHTLSELDTVTAVAHCRNLRSLILRHCSSLKSLDGLQNCATLAECEVEQCPELTDVDALKDLPNIVSATLCALPKMEELHLTSATRITTLSLVKCAALTIIDVPHAAASLKDFNMSKCPCVVSLSFVERSSQLERLTLCGSQVKTLPHLGHCTKLIRVKLDSLPHLCDLSALSECRASLQHLSISACAVAKGIDVVGQLTHLTALELARMTLRSLEWITGCTSLTCLSLSACKGTADYSEIAKLPQLKSVYVTNCPLQDLSWTSHMSSPPIAEFEVSRCPKLELSSSAALPTFVKIR